MSNRTDPPVPEERHRRTARAVELAKRYRDSHENWRSGSAIELVLTTAVDVAAVGQHISFRIRNAGEVKQKFALRLKGNVIR